MFWKKVSLFETVKVFLEKFKENSGLGFGKSLLKYPPSEEFLKCLTLNSFSIVEFHCHFFISIVRIQLFWKVFSMRRGSACKLHNAEPSALRISTINLKEP